ncbi:MAG: pitrilysin family protein [Candidatus Nealsonbacteria bacterium]|nr:pitrilysin family protein [Candidatus Nealsonbacteria bacterium]
MFKKTTLKNGLRIITVPQKTAQSLTVLVLVGTGSKYENKEISGISHFLEHMYFKGTKKQPTFLEVAETLDKIGGIYNAFTGENYTGYFAKVAAPYFDTALDWVSDIYLNSLLPEEEIKKEKGVIIEEINMYYDHPMSYVGVLWSELLYGDQPAGWPIAGTKESVSGIDRPKLVDYMKKQYVASNTIVCVSGKIDQSSTINKVKRVFSPISVQKPFSKPKVIEDQKKPASLINFKETDQTHICFGARAYNMFHPQKYAIEVLSVILGGMMSSRLFGEIREKLGLAYYIRTDSISDPDTGSLVTQAGIENKNIEKAVSVIFREYKKISQIKVSAGELKKAKDYMKGKAALELESSDAKASFYAGQELLEKRILTQEQIFKKIDKVGANDILKVARDIFNPRNLNLALIGPIKEKEKFNNNFLKIISQ